MDNIKEALKSIDALHLYDKIVSLKKNKTFVLKNNGKLEVSIPENKDCRYFSFVDSDGKIQFKFFWDIPSDFFFVHESFKYDRKDRLIVHCIHGKICTKYRYDTKDRVIFYEDDHGYKVKTSYHKNGKVSKEIKWTPDRHYPDEHYVNEYRYNKDGLVVYHKDSGRNIHRYKYNEDGVIVRETIDYAR